MIPDTSDTLSFPGPFFHQWSCLPDPGSAIYSLTISVNLVITSNTISVSNILWPPPPILPAHSLSYSNSTFNPEILSSFLGPSSALCHHFPFHSIDSHCNHSLTYLFSCFVVLIDKLQPWLNSTLPPPCLPSCSWMWLEKIPPCWSVSL